MIFSKNYTFIVQNQAQGFHWSNSMATVHSCVIYYKTKDEELNEILTHKRCVFISDCLNHNTVLVHIFQKKKNIRYIKQYLLLNFKKDCYFSEGAAPQYKSRKNFAYLYNHQKDFNGIEAE